jgi:hypothetical protein
MSLSRSPPSTTEAECRQLEGQFAQIVRSLRTRPVWTIRPIVIPVDIPLAPLVQKQQADSRLREAQVELSQQQLSPLQSRELDAELSWQLPSSEPGEFQDTELSQQVLSRSRELHTELLKLLPSQVLVSTKRVSVQKYSCGVVFYVVLYSTQDRANYRCGVIRYWLLHHYNKYWLHPETYAGRRYSNEESHWAIPLAYCRTYKQLHEQNSVFTLYGIRVRPAVVCISKNLTLFQDLLDTRLYLYHWKNSSPEYQRTHPLSVAHLQYAGLDSEDPKTWDHKIFCILASLLPEIPEAEGPWIRFEAELLYLKVEMQPHLQRSLYGGGHVSENVLTHIERMCKRRVPLTPPAREWLARIDPKAMQMAREFLRSVCKCLRF